MKIELENTITELNNLRNSQNQIIDSEVMNALKNQEEDFNRFLENENRERERHYETVIIPERIQEYIKNNKQAILKLTSLESTINWEEQYKNLL